MKKKPVRIFSDDPELKCEQCCKNLLDNTAQGNYIVFKSETDGGKYSCIKYACKEHDSVVTRNAKKKSLMDTGWDDVDDMLIPTIWIQKLMAFMNELYTSHQNISKEYFEDVKKLFLNTYPYVAREITKEELERVNQLSGLEF